MERKEARLAIMELANMISVPMSLLAVIKLNIPQIIWQSGNNTPLTPSQILSKLTNAAPSADPHNLQRLLRMLTSYNVFEEHSLSSEAERSYSLSEIGKTLVEDEEGRSYAAYVLMHHHEALLRAWPGLHESVLYPSVQPFARANGGLSLYQYMSQKPETSELTQKAMSGVSAPFMKALLERYAEVFEGVERLVDVGGSSGTCLKMIMEKNPQVKEGINFDLPQMVARAPTVPGITHVGGDMFKSIPSGGDAIFIKWILTSLSDDACLLVLKNCNDALPVGGKIIVCDPILPKEHNSSRTRILLECDIFYMSVCEAKCIIRTEEEYNQLGQAAGFCNFRAIYLDDLFTVMEFRK